MQQNRNDQNRDQQQQGGQQRSQQQGDQSRKDQPQQQQGDQDGVHAGVRQRDRLGGAQQGRRTRRGGAQLVEHPGRRVDGRHVPYPSDEAAGELARPGAEVQHGRLRQTPALDGRVAVAMRPSGSPVLKEKETAAAGLAQQRTTPMSATTRRWTLVSCLSHREARDPYNPPRNQCQIFIAHSPF